MQLALQCQLQTDRTMSFPPSPWIHCRDVASKYACSETVCPCVRFHTAEVRRLGTVTMGVSEVTLKVEVVCSEAAYHQKEFRDSRLGTRRCAHDIDVSFDLRITDSQWKHVVCHDAVFIVYQAELRGSMLDTTSKFSGVLASPSHRYSSFDGDVCVTGEFFAGGYSGWAHALRRLCAMNLKIDHRFALEVDDLCVQAYAKSHKFPNVCGPHEFTWPDDELPSHILIHADIRSGSWMHLTGTYVIDMIMMSPPCPPWSMATSALGLMKEEGRLTVEAIAICNLLRPKVILFENVAAMKCHEHWGLIRDVLLWCGYSIRFGRAMNLSDLAPQNRDRFIMVATRDGIDLHPHMCTTWPSIARPTMESFDCILPMEEPWTSQSRLEADVLQTYMDPALMPKSLNRRNQDLKRSKLDLESYRLRFPDGVFGCIMANYGYGHLLPQINLKSAGLYGTLLVTPEAIRFLALPEILILMGGLVPCWLPAEHRSAVRMLGNGISTQHALLAICNGIAFLQGQTPVEVHEMIVEALQKRFTATNIKWKVDRDGFSFDLDEFACRPTLIMHAIRDVTLKCPTEMIRIHTERGVIVLDGLKMLTGDAMPSVVSLIPGGNMDARVSLPLRYTIREADVQLFSEVPTALRIKLDAFQTHENQASCIVVLSAKGTFILRRESGMLISDVLLTMNHHMEVRCTYLVGILGQVHDTDMLCPNVVIARDYLSSSDDLRILDFVRIQAIDDEVSFHGAHQTLQHVTEFFQKTALDEVLEALGWILVVDADAFVAQDVQRLRILRKSASIALVHDDLVYFLAVQLFLTRIRNWSDIGHNPTIFCRLKLWNTWIWEGLIDANVTLDHFNRVWEMITGWFCISKPWRYVVNNRTVNPSWPLHGFVTQDQSGAGELKIYLLLGMHGGGPSEPVDLRSLSQVRASEHADTMGHMADFEARSFEGAMRFAVQKFVEDMDRTIYADISSFLELEVTFLDGLLTLKGPYDMLRNFLDIAIKSGLERCFAFCGWLVVCHFSSVFDPIEAQVLFIRKPSAPAVSIDFLRALLHSALVVLGLPKPVDDSHDAIKTKLKLWGATIYHAKLPRSMPIQDFLDVWDQAGTITGYEKIMRLVSHTGSTANPDFSLRHYSRCGPNDETIATFSFVGAMHGGGPSGRPASNYHDHLVQQKNALAAFMIGQGIDIQECVQCVDVLVREAGPDSISMILAQRQHGKKWEGIMKLAKTLNVVLPAVSNKIEAAKKKVQQKFQEQARNLERNLPVEMLKLQEGFLLNADETACLQIQKIQPNCSGVVLSRSEDAQPWLGTGQPISQDELSLIVVGQCLHDVSEDCHRIRVPVVLHDEPLVVSGCLHHLGVKRAVISVDDQMQFPVNDTQVVSVTAYQDEVDASTWASIVKFPVRHIMQVLSHEAGEISLLSPPWGRSFQRLGKRCDAEVATSVQIHIRIDRAELRRILKASGSSGIYCTPKTEDRKIVSDYMIVWLNQSPVDFAVSLSKVDSHCGVIRNSKGDPKNKGIRFEKADYVQAFAILKPDDKIPQIVAANHHFKIAPTPLGSTSEQVQTWLSSQSWEAKPVRPLSGDCWLCVAEKRFEIVFAQWNGSPILIKWVGDRKDHVPVILAGDVQKRVLPKTKETSKEEGASSHAAGQDDPWGAWIAKKGGTGISLANAIPKTSMSLQPPRKLESPIEDRFARHDNALQDHKHHTEREIETLKESIARIERGIDLQNTNIQSNMELTNAEFKAVRSETASQLQALTGAFTESLKTTIASQESQMSMQFAELKEMILLNKAKSRSSPPQKKPKKGDDDASL